MYTTEDEILMEGKIELLPCQEQIERLPDDDGDFGVTSICRKEDVGFYASVYLSKLNITETCKANCSMYVDDIFMGDIYKDREFDYDPMVHGAVNAIRIYYAGDSINSMMADLKFAYRSDKYPNKMETICWLQPQHREAFSSGINGYTLIYDERDKCSFDEI